MKKLNFLFISLLAVVFMSCGSGSSDKVKDSAKDSMDENKEVIEESADIKKTKFKNCEEFIEAYEKWVDAYLDVLEKYMKNPMDATLSQEYMKRAQEMQSWTYDWMHIYSCAQDEKYQQKFKEIGEKAEKRAKEMGLK